MHTRKENKKMINKSYDKIGKSMDEIMTQIAQEVMIAFAYIAFKEIVDILENIDEENTDETETKEEKNDNNDI